MPNETGDKPPREPPEHPAQLGGFEIIELIGKGGMGTVYRARQVSMDRSVALKILSRRLSRSKPFVHRFVREARAAAKLNHPNIVQGIDVGQAAGCYYFAMEFIDGETAYDKLKREGPLGEMDAVRICMQVANALQHAHERADIIHRDVKPQNILLAPGGVAKLADLGLARHTEQQSAPPLAAAGSPLETPGAATPSSLTAAGTTLGTPDYISPEQVRGEADLDGRCDVYSLGATLYHLLAGRPAYAGGSANVVMAKHLTEPPPDLRGERPDVSPNTAAIVRRAMQKDKTRRYQTAEAMAAALGVVLRHGSEQEAAVTAPHAASPAAASAGWPA
ncbi:MAG: serine/threonine-protein kinase, partial [Planctomycetota bacterium]